MYTAPQPSPKSRWPVLIVVLSDLHFLSEYQAWLWEVSGEVCKCTDCTFLLVSERRAQGRGVFNIRLCRKQFTVWRLKLGTMELINCGPLFMICSLLLLLVPNYLPTHCKPLPQRFPIPYSPILGLKATTPDFSECSG